MSSKSQQIIFSEREDDLVYFAETFEARMHSLKLGKVLTGDATYEDFMPTVRNGASEEQKNKSCKLRK